MKSLKELVNLAKKFFPTCEERMQYNYLLAFTYLNFFILYLPTMPSIINFALSTFVQNQFWDTAPKLLPEIPAPPKLPNLPLLLQLCIRFVAYQFYNYEPNGLCH